MLRARFTRKPWRSGSCDDWSACNLPCANPERLAMTAHAGAPADNVLPSQDRPAGNDRAQSYARTRLREARNREAPPQGAERRVTVTGTGRKQNYFFISVVGPHPLW